MKTTARRRFISSAVVLAASLGIFWLGTATPAQAGKGRGLFRSRTSHVQSTTTYRSMNYGRYGGGGTLQYYPMTNQPISVGPNGVGTIPGTLGIRTGPFPSTQFSPRFHDANPMVPPVYIVR